MNENPKWIFEPKGMGPMVPINDPALILDLRSENAALKANLKMQTENYAIERYRAAEYSKLYHESKRLAEELLEALKAMYQDACTRYTEVPTPIVDAACEAIAKAEGSSVQWKDTGETFRSTELT